MRNIILKFLFIEIHLNILYIIYINNQYIKLYIELSSDGIQISKSIFKSNCPNDMKAFILFYPNVLWPDKERSCLNSIFTITILVTIITHVMIKLNLCLSTQLL